MRTDILLHYPWKIRKTNQTCPKLSTKGLCQNSPIPRVRVTMLYLSVLTWDKVSFQRWHQLTIQLMLSGGNPPDDSD